MYRLTDDLARRRLFYPRPLPTLPDLLVLDIPEPYASSKLPLGRYYPVVLETASEGTEFEAFLAEPRAYPVAPNLLDRRPSCLTGSRITLAAYDPPGVGWPSLLLCHWPADFATFAQDPMLFARNAYTIETFDQQAELYAAAQKILAVLGGALPVDVAIIPPMGNHAGMT